MILRTICRRRDLIEGEESSYARLCQRFPNRGTHDGVNDVFADIDPLDQTPIRVYALLNDDEQSIVSGKKLLDIIAFLLFSEDRSSSIQLTNGQLNEVFSSPHYRLFCCNHSKIEDIKDDYFDVFKVQLDDAKTMEEIKEDCRAKLKAMLT